MSERRLPRSCEQAAEWIALGRPLGPDAAAFAQHVATCEECAREAAFDLDLERSLSAAGQIAAPAGFTDAVMARVAEVESVRTRTARDLMPLAPVLPWWARALADPAAAVGLGLAALVLWQRANLIALASSFALRTSESIAAWRATLATPAGVAAAWEPIARVLAQPDVALGLTLAIAPAVAWAVVAAVRWGERRR